MFSWIQKTGNTLFNAFGRLIGWAENEGILKYPVKHYCEQVSPTLWRGARLEKDSDYETLAKNGFKCMVNLCSENDADKVPASKHGMVSVHIPVEDNTVPTRTQMMDFCHLASSPNYQPLYVHCEAGQGRTGVAVACYRIGVQKWSPTAALEDAEKHGLKMPCQKDFIMSFSTF
jgi:protein tyrosine phosphatase (PTP) superfamily phosphohydrolase (DUF442 family)